MSDPKEALERLKACDMTMLVNALRACADDIHHDDDSSDAFALRDLADTLPAIIAEREGLEREVERLACRLTNAETMAGIYLGQREAAEAQLSALQEACKPFVAAWKSQLSDMERLPRAWNVTVKINNDDFRTLRALLPTVPVEGS